VVLYELVEYLDNEGKSPFAVWFNELDAQSAARIAVALSRIEQGNLSNAKGVALAFWSIGSIPDRVIAFTSAVMTTNWSSCWRAEPSGVSRRTLKRRRRAGLITRNASEARNMALTRSFKETVQARAKKDRAFRAALLSEGVELLLQGDLETGKAVLRDYINATLGFDELAERSGIPAKSLMRMFSASGNPQAANLLAVIACLQEVEKVALEVRVERV
jgi:DNA-binding phage protein